MRELEVGRQLRDGRRLADARRAAAGHDPALKAVLAYAPREPLSQVLEEALTEGGAELALKRFREFEADPVNKFAETEGPLRRGFRR